MADDLTPDGAMVRLLINDTGTSGTMFSDVEVMNFLALEGGIVKLAAAQAIDTIADNEALVSKVIADGQLKTDGAKVADALRKRAIALRAQHATDLDDADDGYFGVVDIVGGHCGPENTAYWTL